MYTLELVLSCALFVSRSRSRARLVCGVVTNKSGRVIRILPYPASNSTYNPNSGCSVKTNATDQLNLCSWQEAVCLRCPRKRARARRASRGGTTLPPLRYCSRSWTRNDGANHRTPAPNNACGTCHGMNTEEGRALARGRLPR